MRPRVILYTSLWSLVGALLVFALFIRSDIEMTVAPVRNPVFVLLSDGSIRNTYEVRLRNKHGDDRMFEVSISGDPAILLSLEGSEDNAVMVPADSTMLQRVYLVAEPDSEAATADRTNVRLWIEDVTSGERAHNDTIFNGRGD
jgi:polyferredoxin